MQQLSPFDPSAQYKNIDAHEAARVAADAAYKAHQQRIDEQGGSVATSGFMHPVSDGYSAALQASQAMQEQLKIFSQQGGRIAAVGGGIPYTGSPEAAMAEAQKRQRDAKQQEGAGCGKQSSEAAPKEVREWLMRLAEAQSLLDCTSRDLSDRLVVVCRTIESGKEDGPVPRPKLVPLADGLRELCIRAHKTNFLLRAALDNLQL